MAENVLIYKIFIASPRGFDTERLEFKKIIEEYNIYEASPNAIRFEAVGWDIVASTMAQSQEEINKLIRQCDYFVLLLHDKWGSSTPTNNKYYSGSHEEIHVASECCGDENLHMRDIALFFKSVPDAQLSDPGTELKKIIEFRKERERKGDMFFDTYDEPQTFVGKFRRNLAVWKQNHINNNPRIIRNPLSENFNQSQTVLKADNSIIISITENLSDGLNKAKELFIEGKKLEAELLYARLVTSFDDPVTMIEYARILRKMGNNQKASELLDKALKKSEILKDDETKAYAWQQKGKIEEYLGRYDKAKVCYEKALSIYDSLNKITICKAVTLKYLGISLRKILDYDKAEIIFNQALTTFNLFYNSDGEYGIATVFFHLGRQYKEKGELDKAEKYYTDSLNILKKQPNNRDKRSEAQVKSSLATIYRIKGKMDDSKRMYNESLLVFNLIGDEESQIGVYGNLGELEILYQRFDKAYDFFEKALHLSEKIDKPSSVAIALNQMGKVKSLLGDYPTAEELLIKSLDIVIEMKNMYSLSVQYRTLGVLYRLMNENDKSLTCLLDSKRYGLHIEHKVEIAYTSLELGHTYFQMKQYPNALESTDHAKSFFRKNGLFVKEKEADDLIVNIKKAM
ncbi:MAG: tetratricopeptide repeat protein [Bacteroidales bacterium]|nr:tetratricopeptide repeat protein [Bacteroidales bacterium]